MRKLLGISIVQRNHVIAISLAVVAGIFAFSLTSRVHATNFIDTCESTASLACSHTVASGTAALGTGALSSGACATAVTVTASGVTSTDTIIWTPNGSVKAVTGYAPSTSGGIGIAPYPTAGNVNFDQCNWSTGTITPGAVTLNWRVVR